MKKFILVVVFILLFSNNVYAHPGGLDSEGGHFDSDTGEYHYHTVDESDEEEDLNRENIRLNNLVEELEEDIDILKEENKILEEDLKEKEDRLKGNLSYTYTVGFISLLVGFLSFPFIKKIFNKFDIEREENDDILS